MMAQRARGICKVAVDSLPEHQARCRGQVTELHYAIQELRNVQARTHAVTIWERLDHLSDILIIRVWPHRSQPEHALLAIRDVMVCTRFLHALSYTDTGIMRRASTVPTSPSHSRRCATSP